MKHELVMYLLWNWMVVCSNLAKHKLGFLFSKINFGMDGKGLKP